MPDNTAGSGPDERFENVRRLLGHPLIRGDVERRKRQRQQSAERFNIFDALQLGRRENYHSRFIGYLLDPAEWHDQGAVFLVGLLQHLRDHHGLARTAVDAWTNPRLQNVLAPTAQVITEKHTASCGRIDLVIELGDGTTIAIENKVDAGEQDGQLQRYAHWLRSLGKPAEKVMLVFLTPTGHAPRTAASTDTVVRMSYQELGAVLQAGLARCPATATPLVATVNHYIQLCQRISQEASPMAELNPQITTFLEDPANLGAALDVMDHLEQGVLEQIRREFRHNLMSELETRLQSSPAAALKWEVAVSHEFASSQLIGLLPKANPLGYRCLARLTFKAGMKDGSAVWWRKPARSVMSGAAQELGKKMRGMAPSDDYETAWYLTHRSLGTLENEYPLTAWTSDSIQKLHQDNRGARQIAEHLADLVWRYFLPFHSEVEKLPDFLPTNPQP